MKAFIPPTLRQDERANVYSVFDLSLLADLLIPFQAAKDREYQSHWAHRGLMGYIDGCILRQVDRIEPGLENLISACDFDPITAELNQTKESTLAAASLMDTLVDTVVYSLLGVCLIAAKFPEAGDAYKRKMLHRVINGADMPDTDLDLSRLNDVQGIKEVAAELAAHYRAKLEADPHKELASMMFKEIKPNANP